MSEPIKCPTPDCAYENGPAFATDGVYRGMRFCVCHQFNKGPYAPKLMPDDDPPAPQAALDLVRVSAAVIEEGGRVRIFQRGGKDSYTGKWEFPGGKLEGDETPQEALKRELREELGVECEVGELLDHYWYKYPKRSPISLSFFAVKLLSDPILSEHTDSAWVEPQNLNAYDLMNADMKFVATRYALIHELESLRKDVSAMDDNWKATTKALGDIYTLTGGTLDGNPGQYDPQIFVKAVESLRARVRQREGAFSKAANSTAALGTPEGKQP